jgi:hypothetical protein
MARTELMADGGWRRASVLSPVVEIWQWPLDSERTWALPQAWPQAMIAWRLDVGVRLTGLTGPVCEAWAGFCRAPVLLLAEATVVIKGSRRYRTYEVSVGTSDHMTSHNDSTELQLGTVHFPTFSRYTR